MITVGRQAARGLTEVEYYRFLRSNMTWDEFIRAKIIEEKQGLKDGECKHSADDASFEIQRYLESRIHFERTISFENHSRDVFQQVGGSEEI